MMFKQNDEIVGGRCHCSKVLVELIFHSTASKALDAATSTLSETTSALEASDDCGSGWVVEFLIVGIPSLKT